VLAFLIAEHLNIVEHVLLGFISRLVAPPPYPFPLEQVEEALRNGVVMAVAAWLIECSRLCVFRNDAQSRLVNCEP